MGSECMCGRRGGGGRKRRLWARWKGKERIRGHRGDTSSRRVRNRSKEQETRREREMEELRRRDAGGNAKIVGRTGGESKE